MQRAQWHGPVAWPIGMAQWCRGACREAESFLSCVSTQAQHSQDCFIQEKQKVQTLMSNSLILLKCV